MKEDFNSNLAVNLDPRPTEAPLTTEELGALEKKYAVGTQTNEKRITDQTGFKENPPKEVVQPATFPERGITKMEVGPEQALEAFRDGRLLARVVENSRITKGVEGFELSQQVLEEELGFLKKGGMSYASSTLVIPGVSIPLYHAKSAGWLFDGQESDIQHVASSDSGSSGSSEETFFANQTDFHNLSELASFLKAGPHKADMNEVNARFFIKGMKGVVVRKAPSRVTLLEGIMTHMYLRQQGYVVPLFVYDQDKGELEPLEYNDETIKGCLAELRNEKVRTVYANALKKLEKLHPIV